MLLLTIITLGLLAYINYRVGGKAILYPPVVFCGVWAIILLLIWIVGDFFYPILPQTLMIFLGGALSFSLASVVTLACLSFRSKSGNLRAEQGLPKWILNTLLCVVLCGAPLGYRWISSVVAQSSANFLAAAYLAMNDETRQADLDQSLFGNIVTLSVIVAMIAFRETWRGKMRASMAIMLALGMCLLTGGRSGIAGLVLAVIALSWLKGRRIHWKLMISLAMVALILFGAVAIALGKANSRPDATLADNAVPVVQGLVLYACGGVVAFDRVIREPNVVPYNWKINRFFLQTMNKFGAKFDVPSLHAGFVNVGPNGREQNVYTIYFAFLEWGISGMMVLIGFIGMVTTIAYKKAMEGSDVASVMYGALFGGLVLSPYNEGFFFALNILIKIYAVSWLVYRFPVWWIRLREVARKSVVASIAMGHGQGESLEDT
jgi:oligosaccharide repeat unit polymerase